MTTALATAPMTAPQGRFLTSLLNDLTAAAPTAGAEARTRLHAMHAAGTLDKAEASRAIDVLKRAIALAKAPAPSPVVAPVVLSDREQALIESRRVNAERLNLTPGKRPARKGPTRRTGPSVMDSLRAWTPEGAAERLASAEPAPF